MGNYYTPFSLRVWLMRRIISNKEMEYALERYVEDFEERHGVIQIDGDDL